MVADALDAWTARSSRATCVPHSVRRGWRGRGTSATEIFGRFSRMFRRARHACVTSPLRGHALSVLACHLIFLPAHAAPDAAAKCATAAEQRDKSSAEKRAEANLLTAIQRGEHAAVVRKLQKTKNPNACLGEASLLTHAVTAKQWRVVKTLLEQGAHLDAPRDAGGLTPMLRAADSGDFDAALKLLMLGANAEAQNSNGITALHFAAYASEESFSARREQMDFIRRLVKQGRVLNAQLPNGWTALYMAVRQGNAPLVVQLLSLGADPNIATAPDATPLFAAGELGRADLIETLRTAGAREDVTGWTSIGQAVESGSAERLSAALAATPASSLATPLKRGPLITALWQGNAPAIRALGRWGSDTSATFNWWSGEEVEVVTPLQLAISIDSRIEVIQALLEAGANPNGVVAPFGSGPPLHGALSQGRMDVATALLDAGASHEAASPKSGFTPLMEAVLAAVNAPQKQLEPLVTRLLRAGADVGARDAHGRTALHLAAMTDERWLIQLLLDSGADKRLKDDRGATPLKYAKSSGAKRALSMARATPPSPAVSTADDGFATMLTAAEAQP